ncbi:MAG: helix-turn-helix domain-containing protein [Oligoflexales bacterium]
MSQGAIELKSGSDEFVVESIVVNPGTKLRDIEKIIIMETLKRKRYNRTHTAKTLGIGIRTLQRKLKRYGVADVGITGLAN